MKKFLASAVGASLFGAGALGITPIGTTAGVAHAAERPASHVADQNGNDEDDVTGTCGDVTGTGHGDHGGSHLSRMLPTIAGMIGIPEADLVAALQSGQSIAQ